MNRAQAFFRAAALIASLGAAGEAAAFATPTQLIRAIYRPLLAGNPDAPPDSLLFTRDTLESYRAWRANQPIGLGFAPFVIGPYIIPQPDGAGSVNLPVNGRRVAFDILASQGPAAGALVADAAGPAIDLDRFSARQIGLQALSAEVLVSFDNNGAPAELLYDLERGQDGWRIHDIRSVGGGLPWGLREVIGAP